MNENTRNQITCLLGAKWISMGMLVCIAAALTLPATPHAENPDAEFAKEVERVLPEEAPYAYHERLSTGPIHIARRNPDATVKSDEIELPPSGWRIVWRVGSGGGLTNAIHDFSEYLRTSM